MIFRKHILSALEHLLCLCILATLVGACDSKATHELVVDLRTDLVPVEEFAKVEVTLFPVDESGSSRKRSIDANPTGEYLRAERLVELGGVEADNYRLGVTLSDRNGRVLTERPLLINLQESRSVIVPITRSCLNVACAENEACFGGQCVDAQCELNNLELCALDERCTQDEECKADLAICAENHCDIDTGACWIEPSSSAADQCDAASEWCNPTTGCAPLGTSGEDNEAEPPPFENQDINGLTFLVANGYELDAPFSLSDSQRTSFSGRIESITKPDPTSEYSSGYYLGMHSPPEVWLARDLNSSPVLFSTGGPDESVSHLIFTPSGSAYGDSLFICSNSSGPGDGLFHIDKAGNVSTFNDVNNCARPFVDRMHLLGDSSIAQPLYINFNQSAFHIYDELGQLILDESYPGSAASRILFPQTQAFGGSVLWIEEETDNPLGGTIHVGNGAASLEDFFTNTVPIFADLPRIKDSTLTSGMRFGNRIIVLYEDSGSVVSLSPGSEPETLLVGLGAGEAVFFDVDSQSLFIIDSFLGDILRLRVSSS